ncbi:uncharacterized protein DSM5745_06070 [Aspergillus mulundensis]|uniref:Uncharacterized protein n=1 Tax=Aspergillus mulundensis TaxID=1810919 RepID=A0A3D8RYY3_9EURO|nr:hypothetical protein DSM5745_06070 [Aspergillus mulundensis]RDW79218.1 hypothetical protein DSM5745_06070 [Aspergillus mulundensis]
MASPDDPKLAQATGERLNNVIRGPVLQACTLALHPKHSHAEVDKGSDEKGPKGRCTPKPMPKDIALNVEPGNIRGPVLKSCTLSIRPKRSHAEIATSRCEEGPKDRCIPAPKPKYITGNVERGNIRGPVLEARTLSLRLKRSHAEIEISGDEEDPKRRCTPGAKPKFRRNVGPGKPALGIQPIPERSVRAAKDGAALRAWDEFSTDGDDMYNDLDRLEAMAVKHKNDLECMLQTTRVMERELANIRPLVSHPKAIEQAETTEGTAAPTSSQVEKDAAQ